MAVSLSGGFAGNANRSLGDKSPSKKSEAEEPKPPRRITREPLMSADRGLGIGNL